MDAGLHRHSNTGRRLLIHTNTRPPPLTSITQLLNPLPITTETRYNGFYEPLPYKDWQYAYNSRNKFEHPPNRQRNVQRSSSIERRPVGDVLYGASHGKIERLTEPDILYLAKDKSRIDVPEWRQEHGREAKLRYIFISYSGQQFKTQADKEYLHAVGKHAAQRAGIEAYWVSCSCLGDLKKYPERVYTICDIVRGCFDVVIAVASQSSNAQQGALEEWGDRIWTLPEMLLSPGTDQIEIYLKSREVYVGGTNFDKSSGPLTRREFPRWWGDAPVIGQLVDHIEGSAVMSPLELTTTALKCLQRRNTKEYYKGDRSYSLMGFLRQRPGVCNYDSEFQAFARLSLANDSNLLLERLICLLPRQPTEPWYSMDDAWDASLWDIYPNTQICGIGHNDTIIIDGARAANIRWKSFPRVMLRGHDTFKRVCARIALTIFSPLLFMGIVVLAVSGPVGSGLAIPGGILIGLASLILIPSPVLIKWLYMGKVWDAQPWFIGVEGHMSLPDLERYLFGANLNRLAWSTTGSPLSRHNFLKKEEYPEYPDHCEGQDPMKDRGVREKINNLRDGERIFTLVDSYTMTVTLFSAVNPPVAAVACGGEGGMQRTLLCSWDWTNNTLYRETVLRLETRTYWRMNPVGRIRLGLQPESGRQPESELQDV
ncbi:MAG: hypothetical protein OHK93_005252 [Ramalina farinacea]|uniref:3-hydroxyisobutyrate dehydrogenase protein n=1 Tax=Ramalina farinacea TaxID=258253 RepID=A0AA43QWA2_9LECA|nr:hypothetical protein [Ramalina farinacea]